MITAHGKSYASVEQARAAVTILREENRRLGASDGRVTEINAINAAIGEAHQRQAAAAKAAERPYVVLYRKAKGEEIFKGRRTFRTAAEQARFIREADDSIAITFYTN